MSHDLFPFVLKAYDTDYYTSSPSDFRKLWMDTKPERFGWFAYDVIITSPTTVTFVVYDMYDTASGGIGKELGKFEAFTTLELTQSHIVDQCERLAKRRRVRELKEAEDNIINSYKWEIYNACPDLQTQPDRPS